MVGHVAFLFGFCPLSNRYICLSFVFVSARGAKLNQGGKYPHLKETLMISNCYVYIQTDQINIKKTLKLKPTVHEKNLYHAKTCKDRETRAVQYWAYTVCQPSKNYYSKSSHIILLFSGISSPFIVPAYLTSCGFTHNDFMTTNCFFHKYSILQ